MRYPLIFLIALSLALGACVARPGTDDADSTNMPPDATGSPDDTLKEQRGDAAQPGDAGSASLGVSLQALIEGAEHREPGTKQLPVLDRLNEPARISTATRANRHVRGQIDTLRTLHYDGAEVTVYQVSGGKELLKKVIVTESGLESPEGVRLGMTREEVESIHGQATERQDGTHVYELGGPMPTQHFVHFDNGSVDRMEWIFPID